MEEVYIHTYRQGGGGVQIRETMSAVVEHNVVATGEMAHQKSAKCTRRMGGKVASCWEGRGAASVLRIGIQPAPPARESRGHRALRGG